MLKNKLKNWLLQQYGKLRQIRLPKFSFDAMVDRGMNFLATWWNTLVLLLAALVFLYYPIGGLLISNIDRTTDYEIDEKHPEQSSSVEMISFLVNREVNEKIWTPNLPFFYPSYFLDNMPNFQLGIFDALNKFTSSFAKRLIKRLPWKMNLRPAGRGGIAALPRNRLDVFRRKQTVAGTVGQQPVPQGSPPPD